MTAAADDKKGKGKGESDGSFGDGKAGAASGVGFRLTVNKQKQIVGEHKHLLGSELIEAIVEFFSEGALRASANLSVAWEKTKTGAAAGFAIVNRLFKYVEDTLDLSLKRGRARGADAKGLKQKKPQVFNKPGLATPGPKNS